MEKGLGVEYKVQFIILGFWQVGMGVFGECLLYYENYVRLNKEVIDKYGLFIFIIDCEFKENECIMWQDMMDLVVEMLEVVGFWNVEIFDVGFYLGLGIYEMGIVRMGCSVKIFVFNSINQVWDCFNVFVIDGVCMILVGCQNLFLIYMVFMVWVVDYVVQEFKKMNF